MYKITIEKIERYRDRCQTYKKVSDTGNERDDGPVYDYVEYEDECVKETDILKQEVEDMDVIKVIKAINGIE